FYNGFRHVSQKSRGLSHGYWGYVWVTRWHFIVCACAKNSFRTLSGDRRNRNGLLHHVYNLWSRILIGLVDTSFACPADRTSENLGFPVVEGKGTTARNAKFVEWSLGLESKLDGLMGLLAS